MGRVRRLAGQKPRRIGSRSFGSRGESSRSFGSRPSIEAVEGRLLLAAHIVGNSTVYSTIQAAVNAAVAGATITVDAGTYAEQVTVSKTLTIQGAEAGVNASSRIGGSGAESIVSGAVSSGVHSSAFYITANDVVIDGFTVQGETNTSGTTGAGIVIAPQISGTHVLNNIIQNNVAGLFLANYSSTDAAVIQHNYFANNNNSGSNSGRGIYTDGTVSGGNLTNVVIDSNSFVGNYGTSGVEAACAFQASAAGGQSNIQITNNVMTGNGKATLFFNTTGVVISNNTVTGCVDSGSAAFRFEGNNHNVTIDYNTAHNNTAPAVAVDSKGTPGDSSGFVINDNNFYSNNTSTSRPLSVVFNPNSYDGTFDVRNNWWGSASGPSIDGPGTGDGVSGASLQVNGTVETWVLISGSGELYSPWLSALYSSTPTLPSAPTNLGATLVSSSQINLSWTDTAAGNENGFIIQRSTDGVNFTQIGTTGAGVTTYADNANLVVGTTYSYRVAAINSLGTSGYSNVSSTTVTSTVTTYISSLTWVSATTGYGTIGINQTVGGNTITLRGTTYAQGIGTHAVSQIVYALNGQYATFISDVGVDDEENAKGVGSVDFQVIGDGKVLFDSGVVTNNSPVVHINVSVAGVQQLTLLATNGVAGSIDYDHSDWAGARLISTPAAPTLPNAPSGLTTTATATQVTLNWTDNAAGNESGFIIQRSTDGINFSQIGTTGTGVIKYTDSGPLTAGTTYSYRVAATNSVGNSSYSNVASATISSTVTTYISSLTWVSATTGYGTIGINQTVNGNTITLRGTTYAKGIGAHAVSQIVYNLNGGYSSFVSDVGVDDEENGKGIGSVDFQVIGDGKVLFDSGVVTNNSPVVHINVSVAGVQQLTLLATNGVAGSIDYDHADWAGAQLISTPAIPALPNAPSTLVATATTTQVKLTWTDNAVGNESGFVIERSTDGVNFTQIGTTGTGVTTYTDTSGLSAGTTYSYYVVATNSLGNSGNSNITTATIPLAPVASKFTIVALPTTATAGAASTFTLTVLDSSGNVVTGYTGTVHFTSTDVAAGLPADYTFTAADAGSHTFSTTFKTSGSRTISATDTTNPALSVTSSAVAVKAGTAVKMVATAPATATAKTAFSFTITMYDAYGNIATGYTGTIAFTSTDPLASLPASYKFTATDAGVHTFKATFKTKGTQTLTAKDKSNSALAFSFAVTVQ
jgi:nitrous oxidase accessory protein NosD